MTEGRMAVARIAAAAGLLLLLLGAAAAAATPAAVTTKQQQQQQQPKPPSLASDLDVNYSFNNSSSQQHADAADVDADIMAVDEGLLAESNSIDGGADDADEGLHKIYKKKKTSFQQQEKKKQQQQQEKKQQQQQEKKQQQQQQQEKQKKQQEKKQQEKKQLQQPKDQQQEPKQQQEPPQQQQHQPPRWLQYIEPLNTPEALETMLGPEDELSIEEVLKSLELSETEELSEVWEAQRRDTDAYLQQQQRACRGRRHQLRDLWRSRDQQRQQQGDLWHSRDQQRDLWHSRDQQRQQQGDLWHSRDQQRQKQRQQRRQQQRDLWHSRDQQRQQQGDLWHSRDQQRQQQRQQRRQQQRQQRQQQRQQAESQPPQPQEGGPRQPLTRLWGVPDSLAVPGVLFSLTIPGDAFQGTVSHYTVSGLPPWLELLDGPPHSPSSPAIVGVPPLDLPPGGAHYLTITGHSGGDAVNTSDLESIAAGVDTVASDSFSVTVVARATPFPSLPPSCLGQQQQQPQQQQQQQQQQQSQQQQPQQQQLQQPLLLTVTVYPAVEEDEDPRLTTGPRQLARLLRGVSALTGLDTQQLVLSSVRQTNPHGGPDPHTTKDPPPYDPQMDPSVLMTGPGGAQECAPMAGVFLEIQAVIGCGETVTEHEALSLLLRAAAEPLPSSSSSDSSSSSGYPSSDPSSSRSSYPSSSSSSSSSYGISSLDSQPGASISAAVGGNVVYWRVHGGGPRALDLGDRSSEQLSSRRAAFAAAFNASAAAASAAASAAAAAAPHPRPRRSPDYNYADYEYDDYEYDDYDPSEIDYSGSEDELPEEHVVPSLATPQFPGGGGPSTAVPHQEGGLHPLPPVLRPVPISTPVFVPVKPTRVVVEPSPTLSYPPSSSRTALPTAHFQPDPTEPTYSTMLVEPTRPLAPSTSVSATEPLPPPTPSTRLPPQPPSSTESSAGRGGATPGGGEVTDHMRRDFNPVIKRRIEKQAWVAGFVYRLRVPEDVFEDLEDGSTRSLRLVLLNTDQSPLGPRSWIQFDPVQQEIYALPMEDNTGPNTYLLEAIDSGGNSVRDTVKIHIHQPKEARNYHHRYTAMLRIAKKYEYDFIYSLDWQIRVVEKIAALFDNNTQTINIRSISENPTKVTWTNVSMVDATSATCPTQHLDYMNQVLFGTSNVAVPQPEPARDVIESFKPEFHLKRLHVHYSMPCENRHHQTHIDAESPPTPPPRNTSPLFRNQIDLVNATAGILYRRQVPYDSCYDAEDGRARNLHMRLLTSSLERLPLDSWLQFDSNNQEFYGLPLAGDVGTAEYTLECLDTRGAKTNDALTVVVHPSPLAAGGGRGGARVPPPVVFSLTFDHDYSALMSQPQHKALLVNRLGTAFGDPDGRLVSVASLSPGSVVVTWHNTSLSPPTTGGSSSPPSCPGDVIQRLNDLMLTPEGSVRAQFADHFLPEFAVMGGGIRPDGACLSPDTPHHRPVPDVGSDDVFGFDDVPGSRSPAGEGGGSSSGAASPPPEDYLLTFLVPSVLMAAMLVLAAVAACCLYRHRRRYAKMSLTTPAHHHHHPDTTTFVTTGIPVILEEELNDPQQTRGGSPLAKTPVIMKEEKPPLPPYSRGSPPPSTGTGRRVVGDPNPHSNPQPYQQPPPPFTNGRSSPRGGAPPSMQSQPPAYRKPTYMPP